MTYYRPVNLGTIYNSLEKARANAIKHAMNREFYGYTREYIDILKGTDKLVPKSLGYVAIRKGHYMWVSGKKSEWRIIDRSGRVMRKLTKDDRKFWGV